MKKRICALLLSLCMLLTFLPATALAADGIATVNGETVSDLQGLREKVEAATGTIKIQMLGNLVVPTGYYLGIAAGKTVELDMAGHSITVPDDYEGRPIKNEGTLTVTGNGTIDTSMSENGGYGAIDNFGVLTIENGTYRGAAYANGSVIRCKGADSVLTINDGTFEGGTRAVFNEGTATINGGTFTGTTCSRCNSNVWAYTVVNYLPESKMTINGGTFTGVQGAVSASVGELIVNDGSFKTVACKEHGTAATFYALYAAGEVGEVTCTINGGTFETEGKICAVLIGNDNTGGDGGINAQATAYIKGGTFIAPEGVPALKGAPNTGDPVITGGTFTYQDNLAQYIPATHCIEKAGGRFTVTKLGADNADARIGGQYYATLAAAVAAADDGDTVTLLRNVTLADTLAIDTGKTFTIDLNGFDLERTDRVVLVSHGNVTFTGSGTIRETEPYYGAIVVKGSNNPADTGYTTVTVGKDVILEGFSGLFVTPYESGAQPVAYGVTLNLNGTVNSVKDTANDRGYGLYVNGQIQHKDNYPVINIGSTARVTSVGTGIYAAGYAAWNIEDGAELTGYTSGIGIKSGKLDITGGTIRCTGPNTAPTEGFSNGINASGAALQIESNTDYAGGLEISISGGSLISDHGYSVYEYIGKGTDTAISEIAVTGGQFTGAILTSKEFAEKPDLAAFISGGYFSNSPQTAFLAAGKSVLPSDKTGYNFMVADKPANTVEAKPATGDPDVDPSGLKDVDETVKNNIVSAVSQTTASGLAEQAAAEANTVTTAEKAAAEAAIQDENSGVEVGNNPIYLYTQAYLEINPTAYTDEDGAKTLTLDITPKVQLVASIASDAGDIQLTEEPGKDKNAVPVGDPETLDVKGSMTLTIPLPTGFADSADTLYIQHEKEEGGRIYVYTGDVKEAGSGKTLTFNNPHGFSKFTITGEAPVAKIGDIGYLSLQDAVDAVADGETIVLQSDNSEAVTVSRTVSFTLDINGKQFGGSITAGSRTTAGADNGVDGKYTFTRRASSGTTYDITVNKAKNGSVRASVQRASKGSTVTLTVKPDDGYALKELLVTAKDGGEIQLTRKNSTSYTFTMPASDVTVEASFAEGESRLPFKDVAASAWYYDAVAYVYDNGMMNGTSADIFSPNNTLTRGMIAQVLYNLEDKPAVSGSAFDDVAAGAWYADAINWAAGQEIVNGYGNGTFGPTDPITREQTAAILWRYAQWKGYDVSVGEDTNILSYQDASEISEWAVPAMQWACGAGLIQGKTGGILDPKGAATRAQVAQILQNFCEDLAK